MLKARAMHLLRHLLYFAHFWFMTEAKHYKAVHRSGMRLIAKPLRISAS
jgi:hypothetical protein